MSKYPFEVGDKVRVRSPRYRDTDLNVGVILEIYNGFGGLVATVATKSNMIRTLLLKSLELVERRPVPKTGMNLYSEVIL